MMTELALAIVVASIALAAFAWLRTHELRAALALMLDLWIAAGLLRLTQDASWRAIAGAAAIIGIRKLVVHGLDAKGHGRIRRDVPVGGG